MSAQQKFDDIKKFIKQDFGGIFPVLMMLVLLATLLISAPYQRGGALEKLLEQYNLPQPQVMLQKGEETQRSIVFVNSENNAPAVVYMLESEKILGQQKWLNRAYQTYALTDDELNRLKKMRQQYTIDQGISDRQKGLVAQETPQVTLQQRLAQL